MSADLEKFGNRIVTEIEALGRQCEQEPPTLTQYDAWGKRIDQIRTSPAWGRMKEISAQEGLVAIGYDTNYAQWKYVEKWGDTTFS